MALAGLSTPRSRSDPSRPDLTEVVVVRAIDAATGSGSNSPSPKLYHAPCSYDDPAHRSPQGRGAPPLRRDPSLPAPPRRSLLGLGFGVGGPRRRQSFGLQIDGGFPNRARYGTSGRAPRIGPGDHATEHQSHRRRRGFAANGEPYVYVLHLRLGPASSSRRTSPATCLPQSFTLGATCGSLFVSLFLPGSSDSCGCTAFSHSPSRTWPWQGGRHILGSN